MQTRRTRTTPTETLTISSGDEPLRGVERLRYERTIVTPYSTPFGWRSLFNAIWPLAGWAATVYLTSAGPLPLLAGMALATVFIQALYMPVHEAVHRTISAGRANLAWVDRVTGSICAFMLATSFVEHRHVHLLHHTHANAEGDPDVLNSEGGPRAIAGRILIGAVLYPLMPILSMIPGGHRVLPAKLQDRLAAMAAFRSDEARQGSTLVARSHVLLLVAATVFGFGVEAWLLFYVPMWIGRFWLSVVFGWLPHHPYTEVGRYRDTRILTFFASTFLIRGHDYHLLHHLFPRVPHYKLRSVWREMAPHLASQGARIEGTAARELGIPPQ